jgi:hypothetical protein
MKRFVFIPFSLKDSEESFNTAEGLSKESMLPIRIGDENDLFSNQVEIISMPHIQVFDCDEDSKVNFVHCIDVTDEFVDMNDCQFFISFKDQKQEIKPIIKEKHAARFRKRYNKSGKYTFTLEKNNNVIYSGDFIIYDS